MKILKNKFKILIAIIIGIIIGSSITVYATNYLAKDITYKKENTEMSVEDALNDLYESINTFNYTKITPVSSQGTRLVDRTVSVNLDKGKYIISVSGEYSGYPSSIINSSNESSIVTISYTNNCKYQTISNSRTQASSSSKILNDGYLNVENGNTLYYVEVGDEGTCITAKIHHSSANDNGTSSIIIEGLKINN